VGILESNRAPQIGADSRGVRTLEQAADDGFPCYSRFATDIPQGFPLVGGRVEYIAGRTAAARVYGRRLHTINLFIWPTSPQDDSRSGSAYNGYAIEHWAARGLSYWAVSDAAAAELQAFERAYTSSQ
jgi:anti-sigma factor RsiW